MILIKLKNIILILMKITEKLLVKNM